MPSTWIYIIVNLVICAVASVENEQTKFFIQLTEFDYEDNCTSAAEAEWAFINSPSNKTLSVWEEKLISYAAFKNVQKNELANISKDDIDDPSLRYKYDVAEKAGDALLESEDYKTLIHFAGVAELLRLSAVHMDSLHNYTRKDVEYLLSHSNNVENKSHVWTAWHQQLAPLVKNFTTVLPLVESAAKANGAKDVTTYWELLSNYDEGYYRIQNEWSKIANLHKKILKFAISNLSQKYKIPVNDTAPAYLFGSLEGNDWTPISVDITPYPDIMYSIKKNLWKRKLLGKSLYKTAASMSTQLLNQVPQAEFWEKSDFNKQCPSKLINFCKEGSLRVSTCFDPTISNVLSAYKNVGKVIFNQMSIETIPVLNTANRYSALEEGLSELFGILAASPAWLNYTQVMNDSADNNERLIVSLMITALNVLPSLAYYMAADMWRINAINEGIKDPEELISSWWKHRQEYEGLNSNGTNVPTFLNDDYITSNKPYLPKFAGTLLAFQFYEFLMESTEIRYDSIIRKQVDASFIKMLLHGGADDWTKVVDKYLEIYSISSDALLSFFSPLEEFIDELEEDFEYKAVQETDLQDLEKKIITDFNAPPTTTVRPTTTSTTTTTAPKSVNKDHRKANGVLSSKQNDGRGVMNDAVASNTNLEPKSSVHIPENKAEDHNTETKVMTEVPFDESPLNTEEDKKPKMNTSKAVWAVGAVLLATIIICTIAIFGRQRCRKTPKNRRYV
nr:PREDICTED: angiotensin-converting enzyme-like [Megachile rotundata]XP_012142021.1 PREDICTED: angiotensin-converting enzyme-like [Megachile rotundata]XP_012142022.1 PREDICTED: angiotensin-converting enzyme-like [Megachile rotundata]